jgi:hypothetical protein
VSDLNRNESKIVGGRARAKAHTGDKERAAGLVQCDKRLPETLAELLLDYDVADVKKRLGAWMKHT